jgi:hypothetical protein
MGCGLLRHPGQGNGRLPEVAVVLEGPAIGEAIGQATPSVRVVRPVRLGHDATDGVWHARPLADCYGLLAEGASKLPAESRDEAVATAHSRRLEPGCPRLTLSAGVAAVAPLPRAGPVEVGGRQPDVAAARHFHSALGVAHPGWGLASALQPGGVRGPRNGGGVRAARRRQNATTERQPGAPQARGATGVVPGARRMAPTGGAVPDRRLRSVALGCGPPSSGAVFGGSAQSCAFSHWPESSRLPSPLAISLIWRHLLYRPYSTICRS